MKDHIKIAIIVEGGVVQAIYSDSLPIEIDLVDHDNLEAEGKTRTEREEIERKSIDGLIAVF